MNILVAPGSFKGSLTAVRAAEVIVATIAEMEPAARCIQLPQADGGDGTVEVLARALRTRIRHTTVHDPMGRPVKASWLKLSKHRALIESASCIGWRLLSEEERRPSRLRSTGLGRLVAEIAEQGYTDIVIGLGGTATNDAGLGFAEGLGCMLEYEREPGTDVLQAMRTVRAIRPASLCNSLNVTALVDVRNPLCGITGATVVYGPQKGVIPAQLDAFDRAIAHFAGIVRRDVRHVNTGAPGMGAAGGLGFACAAFCGAPLRSGSAFVRHASGFTKAVANADLVITGEGRIDGQTREGKTISGIIEDANAHGVPVVAVAGSVAGPPEAIAATLGLTRIIPVLPQEMSVEEGMRDAETLLAVAVRDSWPRISSAL
ncbi:MAG: glycerate kinase [Bacteroidetes bacterium]|nr:glycerate kinase [Bacteroidota bacterium]